MVRTGLKIVSRSSRLALIQVEEAEKIISPLFPEETSFTRVDATSPGDRDQETPLYDPSVADDFFTRDQDEALLRGDADIAVHSAKDLPQQQREGLTVAALLPAKDIRDALVVRHGLAISDIRSIGTSSPKRKEEIAKLYPHADTKALRGPIPARLEALDNSEYDAIIVAACALQRLGLAERIADYLPYDPVPQQGRLALVTRADDKELNLVLRKADVRRSAGLVAIVGCPADASLISHRAETYLDEADVVLHDRLVSSDILERYRDKAIPVGKTGGEKSTPQSEIHRLMLEHAEAGKLVARLHGGDPGIYGHLGEQLAFLADWNIRTDVVPSLTAAQVAASRAHAPLTHRDGNKNFVFLSGHTASQPGVPNYPDPELGNAGMYMAAKNADRVRDALIAKGWSKDTPIIVGERIGYADEEVHYTDLGALDAGKYASPSVMLLGSIAQPSICTTLFTGTNPEHFLLHGPLIHLPLIELVSLPLEDRIRALKDNMGKIDGIIFPSKFAIPSFMEALLEMGDVRTLHEKKILAVGPSTEKELASHGIKADLAEQSMSGSKALAEKMSANFRGRYLYPCSNASPQNERKKVMQEHGVDLVPVEFYQNRQVKDPQLPKMPFHRVLFTSSTTVQGYFENFPEEKKASRVWIAVGPSTLRAIEAQGLEGELL